MRKRYKIWTNLELKIVQKEMDKKEFEKLSWYRIIKNLELKLERNFEEIRNKVNRLRKEDY